MWGGVLRGMLVLAALWWAWTTYASLTCAMDVGNVGDALTCAALAALALVSAVCSRVVAYEAIRYRTARVQVRHPELAA
jgi:hypothetical protein